MTTNPYASAGVDVDAGDHAVELMKADVQATQGLGVMNTAATGGFAGLFDLQFATQGMRRPLLATSTDGVGTKVDLARRLNVLDTVGFDLVGMVVDDLATSGIRPLFMTDYIACGRVEPERIAALVRGVARACQEVECALIAGETAEHPGLLGADEFDIAGAATGVVDEPRLLGPARVCAGDAVVGFASSGLHSNGFSLVRRIVADAGLAWEAPVPAWVVPPAGSPFSLVEGRDDLATGGNAAGRLGSGGFMRSQPALAGGAGGTGFGAGFGAGSGTGSVGTGIRTGAGTAGAPGTAGAGRPYTLGLACLEPTRLYTRLCLELENQGGEAAWYAGDFSQDLDGNRTHAFAHVTGGGLAANLARVIPSGLCAVVDRGAWPVPGIFKYLLQAGGLAPTEVEDAWNLGIGMVAVVHPDFVGTVHEAAAAHGIESFTIGQVTDQAIPAAVDSDTPGNASGHSVDSGVAGDTGGQLMNPRTVSGTKGIAAGAVTLHGSYTL